MDKKKILAEQLSSPDEEERRLAVIGLAAYPLAEVKERLYQALGDANWRVRKEAVTALLGGSVDESVMESLVAMLADGDNAGLRNSAVETLEGFGSRALPTLSRHINDPDQDVRKFVIDILGSVANPAAVPLLIEALKDPDPNVCAGAAENLGKLADGSAVPHLVEALGNNDVWLSYTILDALGRIGEPLPVEVIVSLLSENLLGKAVFDCLGAVGGAEALPFLLEGLKGSAKNAREAAIIALVKVRGRLPENTAGDLIDDQLRRFSGSSTVDMLVSSLETSDKTLQEALIIILGLIGDGRAAAHLLHCCRDERLRKLCLSAFTDMGDAGSKFLIDAFPTVDDELRCFIVFLFGELHCQGCESLLREAIRSDNPLLRKLAAQAAGKIGITALTGDLASLLDGDDAQASEGAIEALAKLAVFDGEPIKSIAGRAANAKNPGKRRFAAILFAALGDGEMLSFLIKDEDTLVRRSAVDALARLRTAASLPCLVLALADEDTEVRIASAGALGEIGGEAVLAPLRLALQDSDVWVRCTALRCLGRLGDKLALPVIIEVIERASGMELITALETAAAIGGDEVQGIMLHELENPDEEVVKAAIRVLGEGGDAWLDTKGEALLAHPNSGVRRSIIKTLAAQRGERAVPTLRRLLATESDDLVKEAISAELDRFQ